MKKFRPLVILPLLLLFFSEHAYAEINAIKSISPEQNQSFKEGDTIIGVDGNKDIIVEVLKDGWYKTATGLTITKNGIILDGPHKGETVKLDEEDKALSFKLIGPEKGSANTSDKNVEVSLDEIFSFNLEEPSVEKPGIKPGKTTAEKTQSIEDILTFPTPDEPKPVKVAEKKPEKPKIATGTKLKIPKGASKSKDLSFMAGCWSRTLPNPDGKRITRECLCLNEKGRTGKVFYSSGDRNPLVCRATVNVNLISDKRLSYSSKHEICSNRRYTFTGRPILCNQRSDDLMCYWSVSGGRIGFKEFYYPFTKVESCGR